LRDRVDPDREELRDRGHGDAERIGGGEPTLFGRGGCKAREPDHVTNRVDVADRGPVVVVDGNPPARVGLEAGVLEREIAGRPLPAGRVEDRLRWDALP